MRMSLLSSSASLLALVFLLPATGLAEDTEQEDQDGPTAEVETEKPIPRRPAKLFSAGLALDFWYPRDESIVATFGDQPQVGFGLTVGLVPWSKYVHTEVSLGIGHRVKRDPPLALLGDSSADASSDSSTETTSLNTTALLSWPFQLDLMVGIDILDEQPVVPYGRLGLDMVAWTSRTDDEDIRGMRGGWHWAAGMAFLLDIIAPMRASMAERRSGIDDAYITFEYRKVSLNNFGRLAEEDRLDFGGGTFRTELHLVF